MPYSHSSHIVVTCIHSCDVRYKRVKGHRKYVCNQLENWWSRLWTWLQLWLHGIQEWPLPPLVWPASIYHENKLSESEDNLIISILFCGWVVTKHVCKFVMIRTHTHTNVFLQSFLHVMVPSLPPPLPKIKYNQASVQICTISGIHYWGKCKNLYFLLMVKVEQICTLGIECTNLYTWGWVYKFVHSWMGERCTNMCTLGWERGVQICIPMPVFIQISTKLLRTV